MTEYWVSQAKKFCEFCKCWITDNKPSVEFHERGKKHQEMVKKKIEEVRKKGKQVQKEKADLQNDLAAIEAAAMKAYQKDLARNAPPRSEQETKASHVTAKECDSESKAECTIIYHGSEPVAHCSHSWTIGKTLEGYFYYCNSVSGESKWELPSCMASLLESQRSSTDLSRTQQQNSDKAAKNKEVSEPDDTRQSEGQSSSTGTPKMTALGEWTTVQTFAPSTQGQTPTSDDKEQEIDREELSAPEAEAKKTEAKFKERATPKTTFKGSSGGEVAFKKRKLNPEKKRNIRQAAKNWAKEQNTTTRKNIEN